MHCLTKVGEDITPGTISLPNASSDLATSGTGAISLTTARDVYLSNGDASITTVDGNLTLKANEAGTTSGNFDGAFDMLLTFDLAEIKVLFIGFEIGPTVRRADRIQFDFSAQKMNDLRKRTRPVDIDTLHHGGFRSILKRHDQSLAAAALGTPV